MQERVVRDSEETMMARFTPIGSNWPPEPARLHVAFSLDLSTTYDILDTMSDLTKVPISVFCQVEHD
jgi:hypothetical protein